MTTRQPAPSSETPLGQDLLYALRYYLGGRRAWLAIAALAGLGGLVLNWSWLVAVGVAPLLLAILPCAAMCALGLCMNRMTGGSCGSEEAIRTSAQSEADASLPGASASPPLLVVDEAEQRLAGAEDAEIIEHDTEFASLEADGLSMTDGLTETTTERS
jgi:hypothetical protein